jgi:hypothetical protein
VVPQLSLGHPSACSALHDCADLLPQHVVGHRDHCHVSHVAVLEQDGLDLDRREVLAAAIDEIRCPVDDVDELVDVDAGDVTGAEPTRGIERLRRPSARLLSPLTILGPRTSDSPTAPVATSSPVSSTTRRSSTGIATPTLSGR